MANRTLSVLSIERRIRDGDWEKLSLSSGVNLVVGVPSTGKTKWLQTLDFILGDKGETPLEALGNEVVAAKYDAAAAVLRVGEDEIRAERRWKESGSKSKVFVDGESFTTEDFQDLLLERLGIPLLNFPKGNPESGQTWPELSFRMLLRHIYRQQRFWGSLVDKQPEGEMLACVLQFLGLAEHLFTEEYGQLVAKKRELERLRARRDQYESTLDELSREVLGGHDISVAATASSVADAIDRLEQSSRELQQSRQDAISHAAVGVLSPEEEQVADTLGRERAELLGRLDPLRIKRLGTTERIREIVNYKQGLVQELEKLDRAETAGRVLGELKVTHCPACDQVVTQADAPGRDCFLCHQPLPPGLDSKDLGAARIKFERKRIRAEFAESDELLATLERDAAQLDREVKLAEERLESLAREIAPSRTVVAPLVQEDVSRIDVALGELGERKRQLDRIAGAVALGSQLGDAIVALEREIEPLAAEVAESRESVDFGRAAAWLEDGMNEYLNAINVVRRGVWKHAPVKVDLSSRAMTVRVGQRRWDTGLGGTDTLYFLMAYQYGLLTLSTKPGCHYPGLSIIDIPGDFAGERIGDREDFIVRPFIDLLERPEFDSAQVLITGAAFSGLENVNRIPLTHVYLAK